jgi:hypothetical protein
MTESHFFSQRGEKKAPVRTVTYGNKSSYSAQLLAKLS